VALTASIAAAEPFGYVTGPVPGGGRGLLRVDLATGTLTPVGPTFGILGGFMPLAFAPDGALYGLDNVERRLLWIDPSTGEAHVAADVDLADPVVSFHGLTFDACGRLFATAGLSGGGDYREVLLELDRASGAVTQLTPAGSEPGPFGVAALGEDLYVWTLAGLARIDPETNIPVPLGPSADLTGGPLDFDRDGVLWGYGLIDPSAPIPSPPSPDRIYQIDHSTGATTEGALLLGTQNGLAIAPPPGACVSGAPLGVPALSPAGTAVLAISLLALGSFLLRRRAGTAGPHG
jgi:hypothetical protein